MVVILAMVQFGGALNCVAAPATSDQLPLDWPSGTPHEAENAKAQTLADRGRAAYLAGDYSTAVSNFSELLKLKPADARVYYNRGNAYYRMRDLEKALADFSETLKIAPNMYLALMNRGNIYSQFKRYEEAIADYDRAIALKPDDFLIWFNRGVAHGRLGKTENALQDLDEALRLNPYDGPAYSARGDLYFAQGDTDRAAADYRRVLVITPGAKRATERLTEIKSNLAAHSVDGIIVQDRDEQRESDEDLVSVAVNGCFAEGDTEDDLKNRAARSGWTPVGNEELKKQSSAANSMTGGWTYQGVNGPVAIIQSRENVTPPVRVCSITTKLPPELRFGDMQIALEAALRASPADQSEHSGQITRGYWVPHTSECTARVSLVFSSMQRMLTIRMLHGRDGSGSGEKPNYPRDEGR